MPGNLLASPLLIQHPASPTALPKKPFTPLECGLGFTFLSSSLASPLSNVDSVSHKCLQSHPDALTPANSPQKKRMCPPPTLDDDMETLQPPLLKS